MMLRNCLIPFLLLLTLAFNDAEAQDDKGNLTVSKEKPADTSYMGKMRALAKRLAEENNNDLNDDRASIAQDKAFEEIKRHIQKANLYLKAGIDTAGTAKILNEIEHDFKIASDGVLINRGTAQTFRNLTATTKIITELSGKTAIIRNVLDQHHQNLVRFRFELDSIANNPNLFKFPNDSANTSRYMQHLVVVAYQVSPVDSALKLAGDNVRKLLNHVDMTALKMQASLDEVQLYQRRMAVDTWKREFGNIWDEVGYARPLSEIISQAQAKGLLTLQFFIENNIGTVLIMGVLLAAAFIYLRSLKKIYHERKLLEQDFEGQLVLKHPFLSALLIVINLFQFVFFSPPFALNFILWTTSAVCLAIVFNGYITKYWTNFWLIIVALFICVAFDNLILQASRTERWFMLVTSVTGSIIGGWVSFKGRKDELREKWIVLSIYLMAILEIGSTLANVFGRYNLSKTLLISGYLNVVIAILFLWTVRLINEGLFLAFNVYTQQDRKLFYLNFEKIGKRVHPAFYLLLVVGWGILFGRNFAGFDYLIQPLHNFFGRERTLGEYTFSINNILLFVSIMAISVIVSKVVSFFAADNHLPAGKSEGGKGIGSWLLLVRITILAIGLFLAVAAAGIPVDRITIVVGALGVGIGFGLQTLVNNLVSGLIIAFEKPVNVGDVVDIGGQGGTMKSIGFRSSVIATWDGADVVMPNGDLLSAHLTNWSLGGNRKRITILIGVAYDADLEKAKRVLTEVLDKDERVSRNPGPVIQYEQFNSSSIDVRIYFWTKHMKDSFATRSDLIMKISNAFTQNGIVIPFPQQDVNLYQKGFEHGPEDKNEKSES